MWETILEGAGELMGKHKIAAAESIEKFLPDTERLPERREEWDDFYEPDDHRESSDGLSFVGRQEGRFHGWVRLRGDSER